MSRIAFIKVAGGIVVGFGEADEPSFAALHAVDPALVAVDPCTRPALGWRFDAATGALTPSEED